MNRIRPSTSVEASSITTLVLFAMMLLISNGAWAKDHQVTKPDVHAHVVAHISFTGFSVVDMTMQKKVNDKYYLYVQHPKDQGISIIDISKATQPRSVGIVPWPDPAVSSRMNVTGDLAIISAHDGVPMHSRTSNDDLVLWDLSDPATPRVVQKFSGVVKWLQDERNFIYVLNGDGLWVVSEPANRQQLEQTESSAYGG